MNTLLEAAKAIRGLREWVQAVPEDTLLPAMPGMDGDWLDEVEAKLEQAIAQEKKPTKFDVMVITTAYEQGFGKGLQDRGVPNVYVQDSPAFHAWNLGYEEGQMRLKEQKPGQPKDVAKLIGDLDAKMHKSFSNWEPKP